MLLYKFVISLEEEMPMENIKQSLSDVAHNWVVIGMITLFLFGVQPSAIETQANAQQEVILGEVEQTKAEKQLKREMLEKFSNAVYKPSEMLTDKELKQLLWAVGFEGGALKKAWAVARAESNGRPMAYNGNTKTGDSSYGIFQINMLGNLGDDRKERFDLRSNVLLFDPVINAEITYHMTQGGNDWSSWSSITNGAAKKWLAKFPE
jgi:hypothetical protein